MIHFQSCNHKLLVYEVHHLAGLETDVTQHAVPHLSALVDQNVVFFTELCCFMIGVNIFMTVRECFWAL